MSNIINFIKNLFTKQENTALEENTWYYCPNCGSDSIGYCTVADHTSWNGKEYKNYKQNATCTKCRYSTGWHNEGKDEYLNTLIKGVKK